MAQLNPDSHLSLNCRKTVEELCRYTSRNAQNPAALSAAFDYLEHRIRALQVPSSSQRYDAGGSVAKNLAVRMPGSSDSVAHVVLGAHYDTVLGTPGADDNASGVAALLELIELLRQHRFRRTIHLVFFAHEEPPFFGTHSMGSYQYAAALKEEGVRVKLMMSLEMLGYAGSDYRQAYPFPLMRQLWRYPREGNFLGVVGNVRTGRLTRFVRDAMRIGSDIPIHSLRAPGFLPPLFLSDHWSFWRMGYPAVMVTDTAFMRNPHYHRLTDTPETLNYRFLESSVRALQAAVVALDALSDPSE